MAKLLDRQTIIVAIISILAGFGGFALALLMFSGQQPITQNHFACHLQADTPGGNPVWTVTYRHNKKRKPWLKMIDNLPEDLSPKERCQEIARKLETLKEDGLTSLTYMQNPQEPEENYICVKTKSNYNNCTLLTTFKPGTDPDQIFKAITAPLENTYQTYQQTITQETKVSYSTGDPEIKLKHHLTGGTGK